MGPVFLVAGIIFAVLLGAAFAAAAALTVGFGEPRRGRLAIALAALGAGTGFGVGLWMRDSSLPAMAVAFYAAVVAVPVLAAGLIHHARYRKSGAWSTGVWSRVAYALALVGSLVAIGTAGTWLAAHRWDIRQAKRWVRAVAAEVRAERNRSNRFPEDIRALGEKIGPRPRLVAASGARYRAEGESFRIAFKDRPGSALMKDLWWVLDGDSGEWSRWHRDPPAPFEEWR